MTIMTQAPDIARSHWRLLKLELRWAYRDIVKHQHVGTWHHSPHASAWLVLNGEAAIKRKEGMAEARKGQWLIAPPGDRFQHASRDCELLSIAFIAEWVFGRWLFPIECPISFSEKDEPALKRIGLRLAGEAKRLFPKARSKLYEHAGPLHAHLRLGTVFHAWFEVLGGLLEKKGLAPYYVELDPRVEEAVQIVDRAKPRMPNPVELSRQIGISLSRLNFLFRQELQITVRDYCQQRKMVAARALLSVPGSSVKEVAFNLGFVSPQHFSRWFRLGTKMTPSQCQAGQGEVL